MTSSNRTLNFINNYAIKLNQGGISNAKREIIWYLESCKILSEEKLYTNQIHLNNRLKSAIIFFFNQRITHKPFQYIVKQSNYYGRNFYINKNVLIPRPETETFIRHTVNKKYNKALEIGTGSGIIAITLILEKIVNHIVATDISDQALIIAKRNIKKYNISKGISLLKHNFILEELKKQSFDLVISNPPYIAKDTYHNLPKHIKNYEPRLALTDERDGLVFYRRFAHCLPDILNKRGIFLCEFGDIQALSKIKKIFTQKGYFFKIINDYNNVPRILKVGLYDIKNN